MVMFAAAGMAAASILGGIMSSKAESKAAKAQQQAQQQGIEEQRRQFDLARSDFAPFRQAGAESTDLLRNILTGKDPNALRELIESDPSVAFRRDQGENALERLQASRGDLFSGNAGLEFMNFNQDSASQEIDNVMRRLFGLSEIGSGATANTVAANQSSANNISSLLQGQGAAQAQGIRGSNQALMQGFGAAANGLNSANTTSQLMGQGGFAGMFT